MRDCRDFQKSPPPPREKPKKPCFTEKPPLRDREFPAYKKISGEILANF